MSKNPILRLMIMNWLLGMGAGVLCAVVVLLVDMGGLRSLLERSDFMMPGLALLFGGFAFTFGGVVCATAVMSIGTREGTESGPQA